MLVLHAAGGHMALGNAKTAHSRHPCVVRDVPGGIYSDAMERRKTMAKASPCTGCMYFRKLSSWSGSRKACHYRLDTGTPKRCRADGCTHKVISTAKKFDPYTGLPRR